ncbi:MAG: four helix bundle protein [Candidatus Omnitrophica bacterium]|nr:four helix bundle protein [Candidatus Omnitrophota bacterium]
MEKGFKKLIVWKKAYELALEVYKITRDYPRSEQYGLVSQLRRAAISVVANIAEGYERQYRKEYIQFLMIAKGSLGEVETYFLFSKDLGYINIEIYKMINDRRQEVGRLLKGLIKSLKS